jgi:hypothetical protein
MKGTRDDLVEGLEDRKLMRKGHAGTEMGHYSREERKDDGGNYQLFLAVYAVYDEGFEKDGAVL